MKVSTCSCWGDAQVCTQPGWEQGRAEWWQCLSAWAGDGKTVFRLLFISDEESPLPGVALGWYCCAWYEELKKPFLSMEIGTRELSWVVEMAAAASEVLQGHWRGWSNPWAGDGFPVALIHSSITPSMGRGPDANAAVCADPWGRYLWLLQGIAAGHGCYL